MIFRNQEELAKNLEASAVRLGSERPKMKKVKVLVASKKCKHCWGLGKMTYVAPNSKAQKQLYCSCVVQKTIELPENDDSLIVGDGTKVK